jgi:conjugative relaxase-like TrwC/TraI family protein
MMSIGKLGRGQERYYLDKVAEGAEDYYSGEGEAEGYWLGDAARDLGLEGTVKADQLTAMLTGDNPATGRPLGLRHVEGGAVPGFDLTFSAPKSVSLTWALGGPPVGAEVKEAHAASVGAALDYLQQSACWTRRGAGGREFVKGNGFLAAAYAHRSSRAGDPQLHTHALIANATFAEGRFTRLYHPAIYEHARAAGFIYEAHLRDELTRRLGVRWGEVRNGIAEIRGFDPDHLRPFSTRRAEILEAAGEGASARALQVATLTTRRAKDADLTTESLRDLWRRKAAEIGLDREAIHATFGHERQAPEGRVSLAAVEQALTSSASHFERRNVIQAVADCLPAGAPGDEVVELADAYLARPDVIRIAETPKGERFTTRAIWELERGALASAEAMSAHSDRAVVGELIVGRVLSQRPSMKPDQRAMVERLLRGGEGLVVVIGEAGTGKTYALTAAAQGWARAGVELRAAAPTWRAANVLRSEGLAATSLASLLARFDRAVERGAAPVPSGSVLLVDEAGMVDSRALARLIDHAQAAEAKLVLIGDPAQLGEIEAGGLFAAIASRSEPIVLDEVIRHRHELERQGAKLVREGAGSEAISIYHGAERVTVSDDPAARREAMVGDWWQRFAEGEDALMVAKRNAEVRELNAMAREQMRAAGRLGAEEIEVGGARFAVGDQIITRINDHRAEVFNRQRWQVVEVDASSRRLVLDGIDTPGRVCVDSVFLGRVNPRDGAPAIEHAYAATIYQAQGSTLDSAFVMADPSMTRQEFYVATSRSRGETFLYATPEAQFAREEIAPRSPYLRGGLQHIAEAAERDGSQAAAHDTALRSSLGHLSDGELVAMRSRFRREAGVEATLGEPAAAEHQARAEVAVIDYILAERQRAIALAARLSPPGYITKALGERPVDPFKAKDWDRAVRRIEGYRQQHGIVDRDSALGPQPKEPAQRAARERGQRSIERARRRLGLEQVKTRDAARGMEIGL